MEDQIYYEDCDVCGAHLRSYQEEGGYEGRSYNHKTLLAYQERRLEAPESSFSVKVCQSCLNKEPTLSNLMQKRRLEWYDSSICSAGVITSEKTYMELLALLLW